MKQLVHHFADGLRHFHYPIGRLRGLMVAQYRHAMCNPIAKAQDGANGTTRNSAQVYTLAQH
tara:strand:- start:64 stop:249 length:186 start_codon:yes stop_codon:yes gene_type:complete